MQQYDMVVVGKGNAALCAALCARDKGASVAMLEAAPIDESGGNSRFAGGVMRINHETGQVLDLGYQGIPGLYAACEMVGGIFYFNYPAGTGLVSGTVFGRIAGNGAGDAVKG